MQIVAADVGNSSVKYLVGNLNFDFNCLAEWPTCHTLAITELDTRGPLLEEPARWFVSSVNDDHMDSLRKRAESANQVANWHVVTRDEIPLMLDLDQPERVGIDRLLAALAAHRLDGQNRDVIVVDCGTALTIDLVSKDATFRGGVIMAGPATNLAALNSMTAALPDLTSEQLVKPASVLGRSTHEAMLSGAWYSGLGAIRQVVSEIEKLVDGEAGIVGTGGGLGPWRGELPTNWVLVDDLVLTGIFLVARELTCESTQ